ncbi:MAG: hypothetical protein GKR92_06100 [Gammaproteobacteria bacterium]|nr:MAG: hypothetical protein GKR92_06100 [Gammaproteobacteria bacterium]
MSVLDTLLNSLIRKSSFTLTSLFERSKNLKEKSIDKTAVEESDLLQAVNACRNEIARSESANDVPSPQYFEKAAMFSRSVRNYENEIAICQMYIDLVNKYVYKYKPTRQRVDDDLMPLCEPLIHRINNAKSLMNKHSI